MSNFTDFFPGGGSGGGALPDPTYMSRYVHSLSYPILKNRPELVLYANSTAFWTSYNQVFDSALISTDNVYTSIVDITSAPNGGILSNVIGPVGNANNQTDFRITIDGKEYLLSHSTESYGMSRATLGVSLGRASTESFYSSAWLNSNNNHYSYFPADATNAASTNGGFILPCNQFDQEPFATVSITLHDAPYVRFEDSCKVEIRTSLVDISDQVYGNAGAATLLL